MKIAILFFTFQRAAIRVSITSQYVQSVSAFLCCSLVWFGSVWCVVLVSRHTSFGTNCILFPNWIKFLGKFLAKIANRNLGKLVRFWFSYFFSGHGSVWFRLPSCESPNKLCFFFCKIASITSNSIIFMFLKM